LKEDPAGDNPSKVTANADLPYFADVQTAVAVALCRDPRSAPGQYRVALKLWIGRSGSILQAKRLGSTGAPEVDVAIDASMHDARVGAPPPLGLPQPIAVVVDQGREDVNSCPFKIPKTQRASAGR